MSAAPLSRPLAVVAAVVATTAWGGQFLVGKSAFDHVDPVWLTALRYGFASLVFLALLWRVEGAAALRPPAQWRQVAVLGVIGFAGFNLLAYVGLTSATPEAAALLVSTMPLITAFVLWARTGARPATATWLFSGLALVGVALVLTGGHLGRLVNGGLGAGHLLILAGATSWVVYTTGGSVVSELSSLRFTALSATAGSVVILAIAGVATATGALSAPGPSDVTAVLAQLGYVSLVAGVLAVLCWNAATRSLGAQDAVLFINLVPVTAFTIEAVRGHVPGVPELAGAGVTVGSLLVHNLWARRTSGRALSAEVAAEGVLEQGAVLLVRGLQAAPEHVDEVGDLRHRQPERPGADSLAPQGEHDQVGVGVPRDPQAPAVPALVEEDLAGGRQRGRSQHDHILVTDEGRVTTIEQSIGVATTR